MYDISEKLIIYNLIIKKFANGVVFSNKELNIIVKKIESDIDKCKELLNMYRNSTSELNKLKYSSSINTIFNDIQNEISNFNILYMKETYKNIKTIYLTLLNSESGFSSDDLLGLLENVVYFKEQFTYNKSVICDNSMKEYEAIINNLDKMDKDINTFLNSLPKNKNHKL